MQEIANSSRPCSGRSAPFRTQKHSSQPMNELLRSPELSRSALFSGIGESTLPGRQPVLLDLVKKASVADFEILGGMAPVPPRDFQSVLNHLGFGSILHI